MEYNMEYNHNYIWLNISLVYLLSVKLMGSPWSPTQQSGTLRVLKFGYNCCSISSPNCTFTGNQSNVLLV